MQWLKAFFDQTYSGDEYDPEERRSKSKGVSSIYKFYQ